MKKKRGNRNASIFLVFIIMLLSVIISFPTEASATTTVTIRSGFSGPSGVAVDSSGNIYVVNHDSSIINKMDSSGQNLVTLGSNFDHPAGIAIDSAGYVYVSDSFNNVIKKMDSNGHNIVTLGSGFSQPFGVAVDSSGNIYVVDVLHDAIKKMDSNGHNTVTLGSGFFRPSGVAVDSSGNIYVADCEHNAIKKMDPSGHNIVTLGSGFRGPTGVALDSSGNIYVADTYNHAIKKMDSNGDNIITLGSGFPKPYGVAVDSSGNIYVADFSDNTIKKIQPSSSVTYNGNGNTGGSVPIGSTNYQQGDTVTVLGNVNSLVKTGYTFAGWNTAADGSGTNYAATDTFALGAANVTLYAKWNIVLASVTSLSDINVANGTTQADAGLPSTVQVTLSDDSTLNVSVTWDGGTPTYNATTAGSYTFTGTLANLPTGVANPDNNQASVRVIVAAVIPGPTLQHVFLDTTNRIVTLIFDKSLASNVVDLKSAITFASNGTIFEPLGAGDLVKISSTDAKQLIVTFDSPISGANSKLQIAANSIKDAGGNLQTSVVTTSEISGTIDECFIATAAYGSISQRPVILLRHFRDQFLLTNSWGQSFVTFYYHNSPPIARFIAGNEFLKLVVRCLLSPALLVVYLLFHPVLGLTFLLLFVGVVYKRRTQRNKFRIVCPGDSWQED